MKRLAILLAALSTIASAQTTKPRLVVLISIDQYRADYLHRFASDYLPARKKGVVGGFRFLTETGADFIDGHHGHIPTATGPGHAALLSGSAPSLHGIVGNDWIDRSTGKTVYCVDDASVTTVGGTSKPMSPRNLLTSTVGDELKLATGGKAKVVSVALKDRASILMSGHASDTVLWFDNGVQGWVSSTFYCPGGSLPQWVQNLNSEGLPKQAIGKTWTPLLAADRYATAKQAPFVKTGGTGFSHTINAMGDFWTSPFGNDFTLESAKRALKAEHLGEDEIPDLLTVSLSSNDYVGHAYGPDSPEVMDISVRTDRALSDFFNTLNRTVQGGLDSVLIVLSADHGVLPIPEEAKAARIPSDRFNLTPALRALETGLDAAFGDGDWVLGLEEQNLYLNPKTIEAKKLARDVVETRAGELLRDTPGVYTVLTRTQVLKGEIPRANWADMVARSFHPRLSGDLILIENPGVLFSGGTGTSHGSPWDYDSHVPIVFRGAGVQGGRYGRRVYTQDIASTVCTILGIEYPTGNMGTPLQELLKK